MIFIVRKLFVKGYIPQVCDAYGIRPCLLYISVNFDNCYIYNIHNTNEDESYLVSWDGDSISSYSCKIGFHGYDNASPLNEYKVCIRATTWNIQNTEVRLKYYTGLSDVLVKVC